MSHESIKQLKKDEVLDFWLSKESGFQVQLGGGRTGWVHRNVASKHWQGERSADDIKRVDMKPPSWRADLSFDWSRSGCCRHLSSSFHARRRMKCELCGAEQHSEICRPVVRKNAERWSSIACNRCLTNMAFRRNRSGIPISRYRAGRLDPNFASTSRFGPARTAGLRSRKVAASL